MVIRPDMRRGLRTALHAPIVVATIAIALGRVGVARADGPQVDVHGLLDVVAAERGEAYDLNRLSRGDAGFDAFGVRLFVNAEANAKLQVFSQVMLRDATAPYVDGAYLMYTPYAGHDAHVLAGKVPWPIGTYAPRTYSSKNPLIGTPLIYQYHSTLVWYEVPTADALLSTSGSGQTGINYWGYTEGRGMAIVDDSYWDVGVTVVGAERPLEYAVGMMSGTPGWGSTAEDENAGKSLVGRVGVTPFPALRFGVSGAYGPYLNASVRTRLPAGKGVDDYHQMLMMADLEVQMGHAELRAEAAQNTWQSPLIGDLKVGGGYVELKYSLPMGAFVAGRWDALRFGRILDSAAESRRWDTNVNRFETGAGYRFDRNIVAKLVYQATTLDYDLAPDHHPGLLAAQVSVAF
jgi:hypothetical protein